MDEVTWTAAQCRHYAMCKIDYLGTGLCPSGLEKGYVAYYPQGRMDIYAAVAQGKLPITEALVDVADTCTLCGICDVQCHFVTGLRPVRVMEALKDAVAAHLDAGKEVAHATEDELLDALRAIVGAAWASNDPAIRMAYAHDPYPFKEVVLPRAVVLPRSTEEVAAVVRLAREREVPYVVRGNGGSVYGMVFSEGIVLDTNRMKGIEIDLENWTATVGAGVTAFDLQQEAARHGLRANTAEPAATVCGNVICTGLFSPWSATYGTFADHFVDMEFVGHDGKVFCLSERDAPNLYAYQHAVVDVPGVCTRGMIRLHPTTEDEEGLLVPFASLEEATAFARELSVRRIGLAIAVLGAHYLGTFVSPSHELAVRFKESLTEVLGIEYAVLVVADAYGRDAIRKMGHTIMDADLVRTIILGLPRLLDDEWLDLVRGYAGDKRPYELLCQPELRPLVEAVLQPAPETLAGAVEADLRGVYEALYRRPQYTDIAWLNTCRIVSTRMARHKHVFAFLVYLPMDQTALIADVNDRFAHVGEALGVSHDYGFLTPIDLGKRAVLEYDYYIDHTDPTERDKARAIVADIVPWLDELACSISGVTWIKTFFSQGCARKESMLYRGLHGRICE
jgi:hypothetical protein